MKAKLDPITVVVAHAEPFIAIGVMAAMREQAGLNIELCGGVAPFGGRHHAVSARAADVVVTDYDSGMALLANRRASAQAGESSGPRVMMLTHRAREQDVRMALEAGAHGYVLLDCPVEEFADGMRALKCGVRYLCAAAARRMADSLTRESLTPRELDVLASLARGNCNKRIASELDLAVGTIKIHLKALMAKLDARSRTQVVTIAMARGLIPACAPDAESAVSRSSARSALIASSTQTGHDTSTHASKPGPAPTGRAVAEQVFAGHPFEPAATPPRPARYIGATSRPVAWL